MEEKKLTDEEIVKALEWASKTSEWTANIAGKNQNMFCAILDLIHRLQSVNRWLLDRCNIMDGDIAEQKAEIERLTRESDEMFDRHAKENQAASLLVEKRNNEIERLTEENRQLVKIGNVFALERNNLREELDELKKSGNGVLLTSLYKKQADDHKRGLSVQRAYWEKQVQQAVKDTAQEALEAFICKLVNSRLVSTKDDLYVEMLETKDDLLKEKYGVEVE